eukprot:38567-Prymnesium_polylepis.1
MPVMRFAQGAETRPGHGFARAVRSRRGEKFERRGGSPLDSLGGVGSRLGRGGAGSRRGTLLAEWSSPGPTITCEWRGVPAASFLSTAVT